MAGVPRTMTRRWVSALCPSSARKLRTSGMERVTQRLGSIGGGWGCRANPCYTNIAKRSNGASMSQATIYMKSLSRRKKSGKYLQARTVYYPSTANLVWVGVS
eukprot:234142-Amphidinium_carterae.2